MLPARFELHRPRSLEEAFALLACHGDDAAFYAGGTELLVAMKARVLHYAHIIDIKRIDELNGISRRADGTLVIGALVTHHRLAFDPLIREWIPSYAELSNNVANIRVRAAGTLGGNLCFAEPHADPPALLCALDAQIELATPAGRRMVPMAEFITGEFSTAREEGELLVSIQIPPAATQDKSAYRAFGHLERPAAGVAVRRLSGAPDGRRAWRIWVGAVCGKPTRLADLENAIAGLPDEEVLPTLEQAAPSVAEKLEAQDDLHGSADYKRHLVAVLAKRAAEACLS